MNRDERLNAVLETLAARSRIDVEDLAEELDVSPATVRRDLDHLAQQQLLTRTRGGAVAHAVAYALPLRYKSVRHPSEKQEIARIAADMVSRGMVVGLNGGTTTTEVARALATHLDLNEAGGEAITVVTNALNIANELTVRRHVKIVVTGGIARSQSYELIGPLATRLLGELSLDIAFLGVDGIDPDLGATAHNEGEAAINQLLAEHAGQVVVVADSSKLGGRAFARICPIERVDALVTDRSAPDEVVQRFEERGVRVLRP